MQASGVCNGNHGHRHAAHHSLPGFLLRVVSTAILLILSIPAYAESGVVQRIAFGSCAQQNKPQPIWQAIRDSHPDLFIFSGDNVYADTSDESLMRASYATLASIPGFASLRKQVPVLATWDDHDFGKSDSGREFGGKAMAQRVFIDFFKVPENDPRQTRPGIYSAHSFGPPGRRVQVILLDTRYFRSALKKRWTRYVANNSESATILGPAQWKWLTETLREPADLRVLVSSIQVLSSEHRREKWANFPRERERLLRLLGRSGRTVLISGDRHFGEIQRLADGPYSNVDYTLYEVTASGLNTAGKRITRNRHRLGGTVQADHFGLIDIDWSNESLTLSLIDWTGEPRLSHRVPFYALEPVWNRPMLASQVSPSNSGDNLELTAGELVERREP